MSVAADKNSQTNQRDADKVLVYGLGKTGLSLARFLADKGVDAHFVDSRDEPPGLDALPDIYPNADVVTGETPTRLLDNTTHIVVSPGIADSDKLLKAARKAGLEILSDIDVFVHEASAPIIGITGSNGKSTVTTLLALMCDAAGKNVRAGANLGKPALDLLGEEEPDFYILELSSFQLQRTQNLPLKVAVLLNISDDHLDWHESADEYREAKFRIVREAENAVINRDDESARPHLTDKQPFLSFGTDEPQEGEFGLRAEEDDLFLARGEQLLLSVSDIAMVGSHNRMNALAALAAGQLMGLEFSPMLQVLNEFPGLAHRMQRVGSRDGVDYINDSKATNVAAAIAAVESLYNPVVLIAGGQGKGGDFELLATSTCGSLRAAVLIGEDAVKLHDAFEGMTTTEFASDMEDAVTRAAILAESGDVVLLAPACASFDQYNNYQERGDDFCRIVGELTG
jgi:UDP-N-acetylmuramoylalanine--D-glutamate ligase